MYVAAEEQQVAKITMQISSINILCFYFQFIHNTLFALRAICSVFVYLCMFVSLEEAEDKRTDTA